MSRTLLALHGFLGSPDLFAPVAAKLRSHRLVAPRLPGHGKGFVAPEDFAATADWLAAQLPEGLVDVVAYSLGGRLALSLLAAHSHRVRRAIIIAAHPGLSHRAERAAEDEAQAAAIETHGLPAFVDAWEKKPLFASQRKTESHRLVAQREVRLAHEPTGIAASLRMHGLGHMPDFTQTIAANVDRIAWLVGESDDKFVAIARALQARMPLAVETIPAAGHNPLFEQPVATTARIEALLADESIPRPQPSPPPEQKWQAKEQP